MSTPTIQDVDSYLRKVLTGYILPPLDSRKHLQSIIDAALVNFPGYSAEVESVCGSYRINLIPPVPVMSIDVELKFDFKECNQ